MVNILRNIRRECDAIEGYMTDPVKISNEVMLDEIEHILQLCAELKNEIVAVATPSEEITENIADITEAAEEIISTEE